MLKPLSRILRRLLTTHVAWPVLLSVGLLCTASFLAFQVTDSAGGVDHSALQLRHLLVASFIALLLLLPHYEWFGRLAYPAMALLTVLLGAVMLTAPINYSRRWFVLFGGLQIQPSEFAKLAFVLSLAWYLRYRKNFRLLSGLIGPFLLMLIPSCLILVEPDLGTALLFPIVLYVMLIAAGARLRHLLVIALLALVALPGAYPLLKGYQKERIKSLIIQVTSDHSEAFLRSYREGPGLQAYLSKVAIASGGLTGHGLDGADLIRRGILPEAHTDFIFAVVGSQWGFLGCLLIIVLYLAFLAAALEIAASSKDPFSRLVAIGLATLLLAQAFINLAMTLGLGPVVGIALPFISYGGSSLLTNMIAVGILLNISIRRHTKTTSLSSHYAAS